MSIDSTVTKIVAALAELSRAGFTLAYAIEHLVEAQAKSGPFIPVPVAQAEPEKQKPAEVPTAPVEPEPVFAPEPTESAPVENVTLADARKAVIETTQNKGRDVMAAILAEMGVNNIKDLTPDQYPELVKRCEGA